MITKKSKSKTGRQAKLITSGVLSGSKASDLTKPSPYAELVAPIVLEFRAEKLVRRSRRKKSMRIQLQLKLEKVVGKRQLKKEDKTAGDVSDSDLSIMKKRKTKDEICRTKELYMHIDEAKPMKQTKQVSVHV